MKNTLKFVALAAAVILTACGGGGGGGTTAAPATPAPAPVVVPGNILTTIPPSGYPTGSVEQKNVDGLNRVRIAGGFGAMTYDARLEQSGKAHVTYMIADGNIGHYEIAGKTGFTGVSPTDRCNAAGFPGFCGDVAGSSAKPAGVSNYDEMSGWSQSVAHLQWILDYTHISGGLAIGHFNTPLPIELGLGDTLVHNISDMPMGLTSGSTVATLASDKVSSIVGVFPVPNMTNVGIGYRNIDAKTGLPFSGANQILVQMPGTTNPVVTTFSLRKDGATSDVPVRLHQAGTPMAADESNAGDPTYPGWAILFPTVVLDVNSTYTVTFVGTYLGNPIAKTWSFTTGTAVATKIAD